MYNAASDSTALAMANAANSTADYIRHTDVKHMIKDVQKLVKNNPGPALLVSAALGFLVARYFSRN